VHVVHADLSITEPPIQHWLSLLSSEELARANRYKLPTPRRQFIVCRGLVRQLLAQALGCEPRSLQFEYGAQGKPSIASPGDSDAVQFNLSHSADQALLAVTIGRRVGVDLEQMNPSVQFLKLAQRFFSARESEQLVQLDESIRLAAFYRGWTSKEAYLKATGLGLAFPLRQFSVSLDPNRPPCLLEVENQPEEARRWQMDAVDRPGFSGSLIFEVPGAEPARLQTWTYFARHGT